MSISLTACYFHLHSASKRFRDPVCTNNTLHTQNTILLLRHHPHGDSTAIRTLNSSAQLMRRFLVAMVEKA